MTYMFDGPLSIDLTDGRKPKVGEVKLTVTTLREGEGKMPVEIRIEKESPGDKLRRLTRPSKETGN